MNKGWLRRRLVAPEPESENAMADTSPEVDVTSRGDLVVNLDRNFFNHPKTAKLRRRAGNLGVYSLVHLWAWTATYRPDGRLVNMDDDDWALALDSPEAEVVRNILTDLKFLDRDGDDYVVHDWWEHNPWIKGYSKRKEWAAKLNHDRWHVERGQIESDCPMCCPTLFSNDISTDINTESVPDSKLNQIKLNQKIKSNPYVPRKASHVGDDTSETVEVSEELKAFAHIWNVRIAAPWGHRKVTKLDRDMDKKLRSIVKHLQRDYPHFTPVMLIDAAEKQALALKGKSWFQFRNFFFKHDYLQKAENLYTQIYASMTTKGARNNNGGGSRFTDDEKRQRFTPRKFDPDKHLSPELKRQRGAGVPVVQNKTPK